MNFYSKVLSLAIGIIFLNACSSRLVPREKAREFNLSISEQIYISKDELKIANNETIKKGTNVKLYIESTPSILKVKCFPITESREFAIGRLAIYRINDEVEKKELDFQDLEGIIAEKFDKVDPSKNPKRKR